jgi:hypothetical protein
MAPIAPGKYGRTSVANPVNSKDFIKKNSSSIRPDERFFSKFFLEKDRRDRRVGVTSKKNKKNDDDDAEEDDGFDTLDVPTEGDPDDIYGNDPEEEAYANQLAEDMMAEHAAGVGPDDDEEPMFDWSDDEDDQEEEEEEEDEDEALLFQESEEEDDDEEEEEEEEEDGRGSKRNGASAFDANADVKSGTFAEADEFADILETSGNTGNKHQLAWEKRNDWRETQGRSKKKRRTR